MYLVKKGGRKVRMLIILMYVAIGWGGAMLYDAVTWPKEQGHLLASTLSKMLEDSKYTEEQLVNALNETLRLNGYSKWTVVQGAPKQHVIQIRKKMLTNVDLVLEGFVAAPDTTRLSD